MLSKKLFLTLTSSIFSIICIGTPIECSISEVVSSLRFGTFEFIDVESFSSNPEIISSAIAESNADLAKIPA